MTKQQYLKQWLTKAEHDLTIIRQGMDRPEHEWVADVLCFHAHQVVEKALKAHLIFLDKAPHGLTPSRCFLKRPDLKHQTFLNTK